MFRHPPKSTLFPTPPSSRSADPHDARAGRAAGTWGRGVGPRPAAAVRAGGPAAAVVQTDEAAGRQLRAAGADRDRAGDRKSTLLNSSHANISYAVFCLKKKK